MVNEAALLAARHNRKAVLMYDFEVAKDKVLMGAERKSLILSDEEKKTTAIHEGGHALVGAMLPFSDPIHKVTIIPRGLALGVTMYLPLDDKHTYRKEYLETRLALMLGAGLIGMQQQIQPGPEVSDREAVSARGALPMQLSEALDELQRCPIMADIFNADFLALYDMIKRFELDEQAADADFAIKHLLDRS